MVVVSAHAADREARRVRREDFGFVGIYDVDWLVEPDFSVLLDNLAASPGAFHGVRFFGAFTAGTPELFTPETGGSVWVDPDAPIDFTATFDALEALTSRGLVPFVVLGFFPPAVSGSPIHPPREWSHWMTLVRAFFAGLAADPRFGPDAIAQWWFEPWNEPNEGRFWTGTEAEYHDLYRATSEAIDATGLEIRLGGPAIAYKPQQVPDFGAPWMERFLRFIASEPDLRCDFLSLHRKGTVGNDPPDPRRLQDAALTTLRQARTIAPERFAEVTIVNNEADEKVGFEAPYAPRLDERNAAWLAAVVGLHAALGETHPDGRFIAAADNANLQLVEAPFDGRRSIMTLARDARDDLLKIPAYSLYELVRLLGDRHAALLEGQDTLFPATDLHHLATVADTHITCLLAHYPDVDRESPSPRVVAYEVRDIPWERVNIALFRIDDRSSNAQTAAGGSPENPFPVPDPDDLGAIRQLQELALARPLARDVRPEGGRYRERFELAPYATVCLWITPVRDDAPEAPVWRAVEVRDGNVLLRWTPSDDPAYYCFEVALLNEAGEPGDRLTPEPMRAAMWVDTAPPPGRRAYAVRAVSASGIGSDWVISDPVVVES